MDLQRLDLQLRLGGVWARTFGTVTGLKYSTQWPGGCWDASWQMLDADPNTSAPWLDASSLVEIMLGGARVWCGTLTKVDWTTGTFTASGLARLAGNYLALDPSGLATTVPNTAVDQAIARGLPWLRKASISTSSYSAADTASLKYLGALLDSYTASVGQRWKVGADATMVAAADPTTPTWMITPSAGAAMTVDGDAYASDLYGTFLYGTTRAVAHVGDTAAAKRFGRVEYPVDLTPLASLGSTQSAGNTKATALLNGMLTLGAARPAYVDNLDPGPLDLLSAGLVPANLALVQAGDMVQANGVLDGRGMAVTTQVVIGTAAYDHDAYTLQLSPVGRAPRSLDQIFAVAAPADLSSTSLT